MVKINLKKKKYVSSVSFDCWSICVYFYDKLVLRKIREIEKKNEGDNIWKFWKLIKEVFFLFL